VYTKFIIVSSYQFKDTDDNDQESEKGDDGETVDHHGKTGYYDAAEDSTAPKFTKIDNMHRVVAKPAGNMLRLKCTAEGTSQVYPLKMFSEYSFQHYSIVV
jgi:hypothetical protein